ncbi:MAG TPA: transcriptional repressor [Planktothrix sp.]|jgi:Fur family ferric uptake transcriptional regulator
MTDQQSLKTNGEPKTRKQGDTQEAIASIVKSLPKGTHMTAPEVYEEAKTHGLDISLSTVYRTLHKLKVHGDVTTVGGDRGLRYETAEDGEDHDHLICLGCGLTIEFSDDLIRGFGKTVAQRKGFEHHSSRFDILGYCEACRANDQARRLDQSVSSLESAMEYADTAVVQLKQAIEQYNARRFSKGTNSIEVAVDKLRQAIADCETSIALTARDASTAQPH